MSPKDTAILGLISDYCDDIMAAMGRHGDKLEDIDNDVEFQYVCSFLILQIGECANKLSVEFVTAHPEIPWRKIVNMRNILVHNYGKVDNEVLWSTVVENIPSFRDFCKEALSKVEDRQ